MRKILLLLVSALCCGTISAQLLYSTKFESQPVGTAYTRPVWQSDGFQTGGWDSYLSTHTMIDDSYSYSGEKSMRVLYQKGGYGNSATGCQVDLKFDARDEAYMSYWIRLSDDFSFGTTREGGKLPGLGSGNTSGDKISDGTNGFTARFMWRTGGRLVVLLYHMDFQTSMGEDIDLKYPDGSDVILTRGEWHHIAERVKTNSVTSGTANPDGELEVWFDGQQVLLKKGLRFRTNTDGINELYFSTFHGGGDATWAPTVDSYAWFDDIRIGTTKESVAMQSCQNPNLGNDKALCGSSVSLKTNYATAQLPNLSWYKDGAKINSNTNQITATTAGVYAAYYDSAWCAEKSFVNVSNALSIDLGDDQYICSSSFATLESNVDGDSYVWKKDGTTLSETTKSIQVKDAGTYSLTVNKTGCSAASDNVTVTSGALTFADYSGEVGSSVTIASPTGGNIHWYENPSASPISTGKAYNATLATGVNYLYASDADKFEGSVGKPAIVTGQTWHKNDYTMKLKFTVYKELTIDEITVYPYASQNVTINIVNASTSAKVFTKTFTDVLGGEATLKLGAKIPAGTYYMDGDGSTGELLMSHNNDTEISYPYTIDNLISITNSYFWNKDQTGYYMYFYNFKVSTGNTCAATPIKLTGIRNGDYPISTDFESQTVGEPLNRAKWESEGFKYAWGSDVSFPVRSEIVTETSVSGSHSLKITYPKGEVGPSGGGAQALFSIPNREEIFSSYYVRFSEDFSWGGTNKEGKLPGICGMGGWNVCDGGKMCDGTNGFSARPIWYGDGNLMLYLYDMDKTGVYGVNYPLKDADGNQIVIKKGEWIHIAERVKINSVTNGVANPDGEVEFWINGVQALSLSGYRFITTDDQINVFYFDTFMGGSGSAYAPANTCYTWFDDMIISDLYDDVKFKGQITPQTFSVTFVDWDNTTLSTQTIEKGKSAVAPTDPTRSGYTFSGWNGDFSNVTKDVTIVATYTENQSIVIPDADVTVAIDALKGNKPISPYLYAMNRMLNDDASIARAKEAGLRMTRENSGNNSTCYNWRLKLTTHPDWYNNVEVEDWDTKAQTLASDFPEMQGLFSFQMLGYAATTRAYNFPDWEYNKSQRWDGCSKNYCGNGSTKGDYKFTEGDVSLYSKEWPADSTVAILNHWTNDLKLDMNQFIYWDMDNEPEIWGGTHDAFVSYNQDLFERIMTNYFAIVKKVRAINPNIKICGPVAANEWSWYVPGNIQPTYNGKSYNWLEYFIMRCAMEEKATGVKMIDVFDLHFYPEDNNAADILQSHRALWDTEFDYPKANGVKRHSGSWDNSVSKEMVFVRCQDWFNQYFGEGYDVTYGISEWGTKEVSSNSSMIYALSYASLIGEGSRNNMEFFIPWFWRKGMWEAVHVFGRYAKDVNVEAISTNESMLSAYTSISSDKDSMSVIVVNRDPSNSLTVNSTIANFDVEDGEYDMFVLSNLPDGVETFNSHTDNALVKQKAVVANGVVSVTVPAYSISAIVLYAPKSEVKEFTVTFVVDTKPVSIQKIAEGDDADAPENPTKIGYDFVEWDTDFTHVSKDLTVTAVFEKHQFTVRFEDWNGTKIDEQKVAYGDNAMAPASPTRENYEFDGWLGTYTNVSADVTIVATYIEKGKAKYTALDSAIADAEVLTDESFTESTWNTLQMALNSAKSVARDLLEENQSIVDAATKALTDALANLSVKTFTVVFIADGKTISTQTINYGESAEMPTNVEKIGYTFIKWDVDYSDVRENLTITAVYEIKTFTVIFKDYDGTELSTQTINYGEAANAPIEPTRNGFTFIKWGSDFTQVTADMVVVAMYNENAKASYVALDKTIASATSLQETKYSTSTWNVLQSALQNAQNVDRNLYSEDQALVDEANKKLQDAINGLVQLDKSILSLTIETAQSTIANAEGNIGDEIGQYPQSAVKVLQSAITLAQQTYSNAQSQTELDNQSIALNNAIQTFLNSKNKRTVDVSTLETLVAQANDLLNNNTAGEKPGQYHFMEYMDLFVARDNGESLLRQAEPSLESIYTQVTRLESAIEAFLNAYIPLAIDDADSSAVEVYTINHTIVVKNTEGKNISIYDSTGRLLSYTTRTNCNGEKEYCVERNGVYFVLVGGVSYSVIVK